MRYPLHLVDPLSGRVRFRGLHPVQQLVVLIPARGLPAELLAGLRVDLRVSLVVGLALDFLALRQAEGLRALAEPAPGRLALLGGVDVVTALCLLTFRSLGVVLASLVFPYVPKVVTARGGYDGGHVHLLAQRATVCVFPRTVSYCNGLFLNDLTAASHGDQPACRQGTTDSHLDQRQQPEQAVEREPVRQLQKPRREPQRPTDGNQEKPNVRETPGSQH